jgi:hypothetical protein
MCQPSSRSISPPSTPAQNALSDRTAINVCGIEGDDLIPDSHPANVPFDPDGMTIAFERRRSTRQQS